MIEDFELLKKPSAIQIVNEEDEEELKIELNDRSDNEYSHRKLLVNADASSPYRYKSGRFSLVEVVDYSLGLGSAPGSNSHKMLNDIVKDNFA